MMEGYFGGTVGKFIGDAIMGFFGDPEECPNHAELAARMALEMQAKVKTINEKSLLWSDYPLEIGIGINTGYVTVGVKDGKPFCDVVSGKIPFEKIEYSAKSKN